MGGRTLNQIIEEATKGLLEGTASREDLLDGKAVERELTQDIEDNIIMENATRIKGYKFRIPTKLSPSQIADILRYVYHIVNIICGSVDKKGKMLALYQESGKDEGIYVTDEEEIEKLAKKYSHNITIPELREVLKHLSLEAKEVERTSDRDLIPVNNGIFNYKTKQLEPFSPDYVFLAKSHVDYNPNAVNVVIHNDDDGTDWDVESWMAELSDDPEIVALLWQLLGAVIRPYVSWNKAAFLYAEEGNNGKSTFCVLLKALPGPGTCASISIDEFGKEFSLEPLLHASSIVVDENDVGTYVDAASKLKAVITNDVVFINRKNKKKLSFQFRGFMVQCLNGFPRFKDKSNSFYRRQLFIPFDKCFTGKERKYIKDDYLERPEVLEYVLHKVLHMNYYELSEPEACREVLDEYKKFNDPVKQFFEEMESQFVWDLLPFGFLYDLYKAWFTKNMPGGKLQGRNTFISEIVREANSGDTWCCPDKELTIRPQGRMDGPEPLIVEYGLGDWMSKTYVGSDPNRIAVPTLKPNYRGLQRCASMIGGPQAIGTMAQKDN